jgi:hypothetical protein
MQQLEIKFFWPLTEQIPLDLDFTPSENYTIEKKNHMITNGGVFTNNIMNTNAGGVFTNNIMNTNATIVPNLTIDVDSTPITVTSKDKPNFIKRTVYKALGIKWRIK